MNCGAICVREIEKRFKRRVTLKRARQLAGTSSEGTTAAGMLRALSALGHKPKLRQSLAWDALIELTRDNHVIVDWFSPLWFSRPSMPDGHYCIVEKVTQDRIWLYDPDPRAVYPLPRLFFETFWFDYRYYKIGKVTTWERTAIIVPKG